MRLRPNSTLGMLDDTTLHRAIFDVLETLCWGDLVPQQEPRLSTEISYSVQLHCRTISLKMQMWRSKNSQDHKDTVERVIQEQISDMHWEEKHLEISLKRMVQELTWKNYPGMAEQDPRIGWSMTKELPHCPLFDCSATRVARIQQECFDWTGVYVDSPEEDSFCVLCGHRHTEESLWGGANVGWVHGQCYERVAGEPAVASGLMRTNMTHQILDLIQAGVLPTDFFDVE